MEKIKGRANDYEIVEDLDFYDPTEKIKVLHKNEITGKRYHEVKVDIYDLINGSMMCPKCYPDRTHEYGIKVIKKYIIEELKYKEEDIEENVEFKGLKIDFKINNVYIHYFDNGYLRNYKHPNEKMRKYLDVFENVKEKLIVFEYLGMKELDYN
ncbi:hypothetical protein Bp8pS_176 [Bacillus phage vB_BpuM-BpSp]|nr:hypothetical protein Bp8pS_176 [Bacillus phage vB_BpuM-BpSp]